MYRGLYPEPIYDASLKPLTDQSCRLLSEYFGLEPVEERAGRKPALSLLELYKCVFTRNKNFSHKHLRRAIKRVRLRPYCGRLYFVSTGKRIWEWEGKEPPGGEREKNVNKFHPARCRSLFCERCFSERVRKNSERVRFFFDYLAKQKIERVYLMTLTPPSHDGWRPDLIEVVDRAWHKFLSLSITKRLIKRIDVRLRAIMEEHYRELSKFVERSKALGQARRHYRWAIRWLQSNIGRTVSRALGFGMSALEVVVKSENGVKSVHPHRHVVSTKPIPLYVLKALWEECGGGTIVHAQEIRGLLSLRRYLENYLGGSYDKDAGLYDGYLDLRLNGEELSIEEMIELETYLWGVHFVSLFGIRYKRDNVYVEQRGWRYYVEHFDFSRPAFLKACGDGFRVFEYRGKKWGAFLCSNGWMNRSPPLREEIIRSHMERVFGKDKSSLEDHLVQHEAFAYLQEIF